MGLMSKYVIEVYALSGVVVRANDFRKDLRLVGYSYYSRIEFNVVVGIKGDSMDRYLVRMNESLESVKTLNKCIRTLTTWYLSYTEVYGHVLTNMESMIHYFKLVTEGYTFTLGQTYLRQESPKGELGCYIVHGQTTHPCRVSIRTPDYTNLQAVHVLSTDHYVADLIATLGTADIVLGSVDKKIKTCSNGLPLYNMYSSLMITKSPTFTTLVSIVLCITHVLILVLLILWLYITFVITPSKPLEYPVTLSINNTLR